MQIILLAAGMGLRLGPLTRTTPKAMVPLQGMPLIDHTLPHLLSNKRVSEILVVGGFEFEMLEDHLHNNYVPFGDRLRILRNRDFTKGNLSTANAALPSIEGSFLLCNVDHLYSEATWRFILQEREQVTIFCYFFRDFAADEMKVCLDESKRLEAMSKDLTEYDAAYVGLTYVPSLEVPAYRQAFQKASDRFGDRAVVEQVLPEMANLGHEIQVIPFDQHRWYEVDTREDLSKAEAAIDREITGGLEKGKWV
jgi:choline kinase